LTTEIRTMLLRALDEEGGVEYLRWASRNQPGAFLSLLGKLVPSEVKASVEGLPPPNIVVVSGIEAGPPGSGAPDGEGRMIDVVAEPRPLPAGSKAPEEPEPDRWRSV
jgi:hypothetical protein